jgi:rubrerythrin
VDGIVLGGGPVTAPPSAEEAVSAVRRNEALAASLYAKLLAKGPPQGAVELVERLRAEAERHRGWAERTLARRPWESSGTSP